MVKSINTIFMEGDLLLTEKVTLDWSQHSRPYSRYLWRIQGRGLGARPPPLFLTKRGTEINFLETGFPCYPRVWENAVPPPPPFPLISSSGSGTLKGIKATSRGISGGRAQQAIKFASMCNRGLVSKEGDELVGLVNELVELVWLG